jgi:hypothetical protein
MISEKTNHLGASLDSSAQRQQITMHDLDLTRSDFKSLLAPFQIIAWLVFHPSAWRGYIKSLDLGLAPDFALADLSADCLRHQKLRQLWRITFVLQPLLVGVLVGLVLLLINFFQWFFIEGLPPVLLLLGIKTSPALSLIPIENIILGISYGTVLCFVGSLIASFSISMAFGIVAGMLGGIFAGLLFGITGNTGNLGGIWLGLFIISFAGSVTASLHTNNEQRTWGWQIGSVAIGLAVGAIVLLVGFALGSGFGKLVNWLPFIDLTLAQAQIIGMAAAAGLILGWRRRDWRWMVILALFFACLIWLLMFIIFNIVVGEETLWLKRLLSGITGGAVNAILFTLLFSLPYMLTRYITGVWAGVVAGILGSGGTYLGFALYVVPNNSIWLLAGGLVALALGLNHKWWLPVVLYPATAAWNFSLHLSQKRQPAHSVALLHRHSVFWDEHQQLPLWGLEKQLVTVYQQDEAAAKEAMNQLSAGTQSWAVQAAQIELDSDRLEDCDTIFKIAEVHNALLSSDKLAGSAGKWLNHFRQSSLDVEAALSMPNFEQQTALKEVIALLNGLLTAGGEQATDDVQHFKTIAASWHGILKKHADELENMQDIPNPYTFGPPLNKKHHHDVFADRPDVVKRIEQLLQGRVCQPLLLYGQRRIGKTTLLTNMNVLLPETFVMLFVDCQGPIAAARDEAGFFYNFGRALCNDAEEKYPALNLPPLNKETLTDDPVAGFDEWLVKLERAVGDRIILLALDEFVTIDEAFGDKRLQPSAVLGMFRHIIQHRPRFRLLFSGTHTFAELQQWASYLINVQTVHISYLSDNEARQLVEQPAKYFPLRYTPEASQRVLSVTRQHPALVQLLCGEIVQLKNTQPMNQRLKVQVDDVEAAIPQALKFGGFFFADIEQNQIGEIGQVVLRFMASHDEGAVVSLQALEAKTQSATELEKTLALLVQRELVEAEGDGYRFQVEMIRRWFSGRIQN